MSSSPSRLLKSLSELQKRHPAFAGILRIAKLAVLGAIGDDGEFALILRAIQLGANTYADLHTLTGLSKSQLHKHLHQLVRDGQVEFRYEPPRGDGRPRKLFVLKTKPRTTKN